MKPIYYRVISIVLVSLTFIVLNTTSNLFGQTNLYSTFQWSRQFQFGNYPYEDMCYDIKVDQSNFLYVNGQAELAHVGYFSKFTSNGNLLSQITDSLTWFGTMCLLANGNIFYAGNISGNVYYQIIRNRVTGALVSFQQVPYFANYI